MPAYIWREKGGGNGMDEHGGEIWFEGLIWRSFYIQKKALGDVKKQDL